MIEKYQRYITANIRAFYKRKIIAPIAYLLLLTVLWFLFPLGDILHPAPFVPGDHPEEAFANGSDYVNATFTELTFTGYTSSRFGATNGYWYYEVRNGDCFLVLLDPQTCEEGLPTIRAVSVTCRLMEGNAQYHALLDAIASDLDWTSEGIHGQMSNLYFSEPDYNPISNFCLFLIYFGTGFFAMFSLLRYLCFICFPVTAPACQDLVVYGNPRKLLEQAEEELATLPQLASEDLFITENFFIMTSPYGNAIIPIQEILWIYKYSTLQKFLWYHFNISYTLHIFGNKHLFIQCPKNMKSNIDGIIDYLAEANHNIMVGFNEKNRIKAQANQGKPFGIEKLIALLRRKV